ncbi:MAG: hypothetical protein ABIP17_16045 [Ilumatobacteraceae bacterium]
MITTGITGQTWRASITPWGSIEPWDDDTASLQWYVAADDRWHVPADEQSVRQQRIDGVAVVETRVRVPSGDVAQRIYSVADGGGLTIVEIENESAMPVAIAFDRRDVLTERPIGDVPIEGIELPVGAFVAPLGHRATIRVAIAHGAQRSGPVPSSASAMMQVVRGWLTLTERASRLVLPDGERGGTLARAATSERCEIALGSIPAVADDAVGFALALNELVRMGERPDHWIPELADAVADIAPVHGWDGDVALVAARRVLIVADEARAVRDLDRIVAHRPRSVLPTVVPSGVRSIAWIESMLASGPDLLPVGLPTEWLGQSFEVYDVPTTGRASVSFAVRWHGERPAVIWEQTGERVSLTASVLAPDWSSAEQKGEALWPPPPGSAALIVTDPAAVPVDRPADRPGAIDTVEPGDVGADDEPSATTDDHGDPGSFT